MTVSTRFVALSTWIVIACVTGACGQSSFSPTAPSSVSGSPSASTSGAVITGSVNGVPASTAATASFHTTAASTVTVTVVGTNISASLDGTGRFTLSGVPAGNVQLKFSGQGVDATVTLASVTTGDRIDITVTVVNGSSARVDSEHREHSGSGNRTEVEGAITAIDASARTLQVGGKTVEVPTSAVIRGDGKTLTFADLHVGDLVEIHATVDGTRIIATEVHVENDADDDDDDADDDADAHDGMTEVKGAVSGLGGTCPSINFTVNSIKVTTNSTTRFEDGTCSSVQNTKMVEVKGTKQSDGSLLASTVELD